ncbi:lipase family protein [Teredinibacter sp. KSP-S5-2]|uniref:lipase family protein n=1 Tax=Teredinibacter sp. KSP-S5-2 TaxID=3034506 RepID=UPI00293522BC|nr:lipase family protein [Teredinibacter sp. KSP-S5-2]WNO09771.1 lipase family protein [Teredinibacter sp. KSP-S5-2]
MPRLAPALAANLASSIYALVDFHTLDEAVTALKTKYGSILDINPQNMVSGRTGGPSVLKSRSGFGFVCLGKDTYKGHAFLIFRGTKFLADWLTNFNMGVSSSAFGQPMHDGFNQAFHSMLPQLSPFISQLKIQGVHSIHCIGHSLGGALATRCAEQIKSSTATAPYLYTFGAPRVGLRPFADTLTSNLSAEKMFRVYHRTDIVPCIPFWPFIHAPTTLGEHYDYYQPSPGEFPGAQWHSMQGYINTVGNQGWAALRNRKAKLNDPASIEGWINRTSPISFNLTNLEWLDKAINYVLNKCFNFVGSFITSIGSGTFTLMDRLAYILSQGINLAKNLSSLVLALIRKIMSLLGMKPVLDKVDATYAFIRGIFQRLSHRLSMQCQQVLDSVLINGHTV